MISLGERWAEHARRIEERLGEVLPAEDQAPPLLHRAMRYCTLGGGKRLRGFLVTASAEAAGTAIDRVLPAACAVELVHAYSLVHDDLPCMDDDDWRRGRPATHRVFGEAVGLLAGDALLTLAFEALVAGERRAGVPDGLILSAVAELATASGSLGMVGGQTDDLLGEGRPLALAALESIHRRKTGALIRCAARLGGLLGGANEDVLGALARYGEHIGLAFQITDDLLDVEGESEKTGKPVRRDAERAKATYPRLIGVEEARRRAQEAVARAKETLAVLGTRGETLAALADFILKRDR